MFKKIFTKLIILKRKRAITAFDIVLFLRQFSTLITAGIPIIQSCEILEKSQEKTALRILIYTIKRHILSGKNLFYSLKHYPHYFNELTCQLIYLGEHTGQLDEMLNAVARYQEKNLAFKKQLQQALFYPCLITITAIMITIGMFLFVIPRFAELFHDVPGKLPLLTLCIFYLSQKLQQFFWVILSIFFLFTLLLCQQYSQQRIKNYLSRFFLTLPLMHSLTHKILLARFTRSLSIAFGAGITITDALKLSVSGHSHLEFIHVISQLRAKVSTGLQLHHAMQGFPLFPRLMMQMVKIGEEAGMLAIMLEKSADFFEADIEQFISHFSKLLEPLIMVLLGVLIGGLVIGMYLPIFKLGSAI